MNKFRRASTYKAKFEFLYNKLNASVNNLTLMVLLNQSTYSRRSNKEIVGYMNKFINTSNENNHQINDEIKKNNDEILNIKNVVQSLLVEKKSIEEGLLDAIYEESDTDE